MKKNDFFYNNNLVNSNLSELHSCWSLNYITTTKMVRQLLLCGYLARSERGGVYRSTQNP